MRAVGITAPGGPEVLQLIDRTAREPGPGEVRIRVRAAAVNPTDIGLRQHGDQNTPPPWTPGMDAAGEIETAGEAVEHLAAGEQVMAAVTPRRLDGGAQAELLVVPATSVVPIPDGVSVEQAATLPMNGLTARLGLDLLALAPGQTLAVSGGAGVLGSYVITLAKQAGLTVIADAKAQDADAVRGYGADTVIARGDDFAAAVREQAPDGVDGVYDTALLNAAALPALRDGGAMAVVRGWTPERTERGLSVHQVWVRTVLERTDWLRELRELASAGRLALRVAGEYPPERAADAHRAMEAGGLRGRALIVF